MLPVRRAGRVRRSDQDRHRAQRHQQLPRRLHSRREHALPRRGAHVQCVGRGWRLGPDRLRSGFGQIDAGHGDVPADVQDPRAGEDRHLLHAPRRGRILPGRRDDWAARRERLRQDNVHGAACGTVRQEGKERGRGAGHLGWQARGRHIQAFAGLPRRLVQAAALCAAPAQVPRHGPRAIREVHPERVRRSALPAARAAPTADGVARAALRQEPVGW
mmetsp:Transcript_31532/g.82412  ORF Transcript_31532/g.82412 Transcript_31532/m.82412 type:complete len:217 (+) Transcript_31532:1004-1654(+)